MNFGEPRDIGSMRGITPAVKYLLILNVAVFALEYYLGFGLSRIFALRANWYQTFEVGQLFTYMFIHGGTWHLFANMLGLYFIGPTVERTLGSYRFFILYYVAGMLGGLGWSILSDPAGPPCVGASGAVMGILGAFGALYPNARLLLYFVIPVRAWVLVLGLAIWELHETITTPMIGGIANAAHLIGGIAGFSYALSLKHPHLIQQLKGRMPFGKKGGMQPRRPAAKKPSLSKAEIDHILDKIGKEGMGALSPREREMLKRATRR